MRLIISGRQTGKTLAAIRDAAARDAYLVVRSHSEACRVRDVAEREGLTIRFPITFEEFLQGRFARHRAMGFIVDGADALIQHFARGVPVYAATLDEPTTPAPPGAPGEP